MKSGIIFILLFVLSIHAFAQENIAVITDKGTKHIPVYLREGRFIFHLKTLLKQYLQIIITAKIQAK